MDDGQDSLAPRLEVVAGHRAGETRIVELRGELDVATIPPFRQALEAAVEGDAPRVLVDLCDVTFIDSTALMTLLNALRRLHRRGGHLALSCGNPTVLRLFEVTRTAETFEIFPDRESALGHLDAAA